MTARWACISGAHGSNRAAVVREVAALVEGRTAGFTQAWRTDAEGARTAIELRRLRGGDVVVVGRKSPGAQGATHCETVFDEDAFCAGLRWLEEDAPAADIVIIDDLSKLEATGGGHCAAARWALSRDALVVLSIRADQLAAVMERLGIDDEPVALLEVPAEEDAVRAFARAVSRA